MEENIKSRFYAVMEALGLTDYRVYTDVEGITKNMMVKLRNGVTGEVSTKILAPFCMHYKDVNANYLLTGMGAMFKSEEQVTPAIDKDVEYLKSIISAQSKTIETQERTISMLERQLQIVGENNSNQPMQTIV